VFSDPGGGALSVAAPVEVTGACAVGSVFGLFSPHAAISAVPAVAPTPINASLRSASLLDSKPSTWSVAISSAM
jgi:hypothetical protein